MNKRTILPILGLIAIVSLFGIASFFTLNSIKGLTGVSFSWSHCVAPLFGVFCGLTGSFALLGGMLSVRFIGTLFGVVRYTYFGLPTFAGSLFWATGNRVITMGIPLLCMILFIAHPIGYFAAPYAFYWLIPSIIGFFKTRNSLLISLASTFTAHAVGSVMHLYLVNPMSSTDWLKLIPIVACERIAFAVGMCACYNSIKWLLCAGSIALHNRFADNASPLN